MDCGTDEPGNVKRNVGFRLHDVINTKEQANNIKINKRCIWRKRYTNPIQWFMLKDWSLLS